MLAIAGISASSLGDNPVTEIAHPDDIAEMSANFGRLARGEIESYRHEARYFRTDGSVAWVDSTVSLIRDGNGKPKFGLTMAQDVSERAPPKTSFGRRRRWKRSAGSPAASRTTSTTC